MTQLRVVLLDTELPPEQGQGVGAGRGEDLGNGDGAPGLLRFEQGLPGSGAVPAAPVRVRGVPAARRVRGREPAAGLQAHGHGHRDGHPRGSRVRLVQLLVVGQAPALQETRVVLQDHLEHAFVLAQSLQHLQRDLHGAQQNRTDHNLCKYLRVHK